METKLAANRIAERKLRDKQARRAQIISAARRIAELEGWSNVTVRRLSDEISYSQPVLYAHFGSREGILAAVAIEGFQEIGLALEKARKRVKRGNAVESVAAAYLEFAASSPALYEVMFSLSLSVPFDDAATPPELRFAFSQLLELFQGQSSKSEVTIGTVLGEPPWYRRANKNQAISAQPSERAREGARRALHLSKMKRHRWFFLQVRLTEHTKTDGRRPFQCSCHVETGARSELS